MAAAARQLARCTDISLSSATNAPARQGVAQRSVVAGEELEPTEGVQRQAVPTASALVLGQHALGDREQLARRLPGQRDAKHVGPHAQRLGRRGLASRAPASSCSYQCSARAPSPRRNASSACTAHRPPTVAT